MRPVILFRAGLAEEEEVRVCAKYFPVITQRSHVKKDDLVIPRYSALPWYKEFEEDISYSGGKIINTFHQHNYVADLKNWYYHLEEYTPKTWFFLDQIPKDGPFVLKGQTNSMKQSWNTHMFARNKKEAIRVHSRLCEDSYIGAQSICVRQYVPLKHLTNGLQGLPISEEYRFFVLNGEMVSGAFYWSAHSEYIKEDLGISINPDSVPEDFLNKIISIVSPNIPFFVVDVAKTANEKWIVIELNDGSMSGLSDNDPEILYSNMKKVLSK